jgi:hypothetical protein
MIPYATLYDFGVLTSSVHMIWMKAICGRLETRYIYSKDIVYNNFPWPNVTDEQKKNIEKLAQTILDVRMKYPECSFADLYDPKAMPLDLFKAHRNLDRAVMKVYGFLSDMKEAEIVAAFMQRYQELSRKEY